MSEMHVSDIRLGELLDVCVVNLVAVDSEVL